MMDDILLSEDAYRELVEFCYITGIEDIYKSPEEFVKEMIKKAKR